MKYLYHYTNINTLKLILQSKKIRFNRLDQVDDLEEQTLYTEIDFSKYIYVSCWTKKEKESIPQWYMYSNKMKGVRLRLPVNFFKIHNVENYEKNGRRFTGSLKSIITPDMLLDDNYQILTYPVDQKGFLREINYVPNLENIYKNYSSIKIDEEAEKFNIQIKNIKEFATYKRDDWAFQEEMRFVLTILPNVNFEPPASYAKRQGQNLYHCFKNSIPTNMLYFDLDIDLDVLNEVEITLGPLCNESDKKNVENSLIQNNICGTVGDSFFKGKIKKSRQITGV